MRSFFAPVIVIMFAFTSPILRERIPCVSHHGPCGMDPPSGAETDMATAQQVAALRQTLREAFPTTVPSMHAEQRLHGEQVGLSTGLPVLDRLLAGQGLPRGRIAELTGTTSSGKTTLALQLAARATQAGQPVAWIDAPHAFYPPSALRAGVVQERLLLIRPAELGQALRAADILLRGQAFPLVIFDWSSDPAWGNAPSDPGTAVARLNGLCALSQTSLLFITSPRTAREPLRYYASLRLETRREEVAFSPAPPEQEGSRTAERPRLRLVGMPVRAPSLQLVVQVVKNKLGAPGGRCEVKLDGTEADRMPLHPGLPHSGAATG